MRAGLRRRDVFEQALAFREAEGASENSVLIARWSVAVMWRLLGQTALALAEQRDIAQQRGEQEGAYNLAEIAKCLAAMEKMDEARPFALRAIELFKASSWVDQDAIDALEALGLT